MFTRKFIASLSLVVAIAISGYFLFLTGNINADREQYEEFLRSHPYYAELSKRPVGKTIKKDKKRPDRPDLAYMQDYLRTMDPNKKRPMPELLYEQNRITARVRDRKDWKSGRQQFNSLADATQWQERGPASVGGRTRAILFDPADPTHKKVWAGGTTGGLWYNEDITNANVSWQKVDDLWDNMSISCITDDPNSNQIMYVGTGESHLDARGGGIWKTTDGGESWTRLTSTQEFLLVRDIVVRNENGSSVVYAAINPTYDLDNPPTTAGLYRSTDGGNNWQQVLPLLSGTAPNNPTDIEIGSDNSIWVGAKATGEVFNAKSTIYRSETGVSGSWEVDASFTSSNDTFTGQIELAAAPTDANLVYAIIEQDGVVGAMIKTTNKGVSWSNLSSWPEEVVDTSIPAEDFTRGQAWYDLAIAVSPVDKQEVIVGGINLFKTTNGGSSWTQLSKWHSTFAAIQPYVHADQHEILYRPGFPEQAIFGNDGGVYYGSNLTAGTSSASINARNKDYNVTQFYTGAIHPSQADYMLGGTQDNGTQKFTESGFGETSEAFGGDGALCFIDQKNPQIQMVSYVYNYVVLSRDGGNNFDELILDDQSTGSFINVGEYDSNLKILYTAKDENSIYRVTKINTDPTVTTLSTPSLGSIATALRLSPFVASHSNLYVGTGAGRLFKVENAETNSPVTSEITGPDFPLGAISGIAFGSTEDQILVTFFNYGVVSIWETRDGGDTWVDREGDLQNMPVRWVEYHPHNPDQAYIATELGVWSTDNINVAEPVWRATNGGLANVRTDMLRLRPSDGIMMAATHGRGVFTALIPSALEQEISFTTLPVKTFGDAPFTLSATSTSQLPVSFMSSDPAVASIEGNELTIHAAGEVTISALQLGNIHYKEATPVEQTLTINKASQIISFDLDNEFDVSEQEVLLNASSNKDLPVSFISSNPGVAVVNGNRLSFISEGSTTITAVQSGDDNFLAATSVERPVNVVQRIIQLEGTLDFGEVIVGEEAILELQISNSGSGTLSILDVELPEGFSASAPEKVGDHFVVEVKFKPTKVKEYAGDLTVTSNAGSGNSTTTVSGEGISITHAERMLAEEIKVFPNPSSDWITIQAPRLRKISTIKLFDERGVSVSRSTESTNEGIRVNVSELPKGIYILAVPTENRIAYKKFTKN